MSSMLVVGSVAFDTLHMPSGRYPKILGGSATYASIAASVFTKVQLVGVVGRDFPESAVQLLEKRGIDLEGLEIVDGQTFHWEGEYTADLSARTSLATELNVFAEFHPKIPNSFRNAPFVMLGNIDPVLQLEVLEQVERPKLVIADTMNFWIDGKPKELAAMLKKVDLLVINEEESRQLAGVHNIVKVARELHKMGPRIVVIKRGEYGALLFEQNEVFSAPAYPIDEVVDPTGAGDTFAGGLLGYLAREGSTSGAALRKAVIYGSALASYCVEGVGTEKLAKADRSQVQQRFSQFQTLAHFASDEELRSRAGHGASETIRAR